VGEREAHPGPLAVQAGDDDDGLSAFFIHGETIRRGDRDLVRRSIVEKGFEILLEVELCGDRRAQLAEWLSARDVAVGSDDIATALVAFDLLPITAEGTDGVAVPPGWNDRHRVAADAAMKEVNRLPRPGSRYVPVSGPRSSRDAWSLLDSLAPDRSALIRKEIAARRAAFATSQPVRELSSIACRAKVELIDYKGSLAVRKTFRPGAERYLERELAVFRELGPHCPAIPALLEHGPNHLVMEYVDEADQLGLPDGEALLPLPLDLVRQLADFVRTCVAHGFDPIDLKPDGNAIFTRAGVKIIDYEFWRRCPADTRPEHCYSLAGLPDDFDGDRPMGLWAPFRPYPSKWLPFTGLPVRSFLYDPPWLQRLKRLPWPAIAILRRVGRAGARFVRGRGRADGTPR